MSRDYIAALDIGSATVTCVVGRGAAGGVDIIGMGSAPSSGVRKGVIVDLEATGAAVYEAVAMASDSSGVEVRSVYASVAGSHINCIDSYGATGIRGKSVTQADIDRVIESASTIFIPLDREVLHVLPKDYAIDGQEGILKPHGMSGVRLEANVRVITAAQSALDNIIACCNMAGVKVVDMVFEGIASAKSTLMPEELEAGAVVVNMGAGTTDVAVFRDGGLTHAAVIPVGGHQFTNDLSVGLRMSLREAERMKTEYGFVAGAFDSKLRYGATLMDGTDVTISAGAMRDILRPRAMELLDIVAEASRPFMFGTSGSCVVLTGGAASLRGLDSIAGAATGMPARIGVPVNAFCEVDKLIAEAPTGATGVGLLIYGYEKEAASGGYVLGAIGKMFKGFGRMFSGSRGRGYTAKKHVLAEPGA